MSDRNIQKKYEILKARLNAVIEEHADALAIAQIFKEDLDSANLQLQEAKDKELILQRKLEEYNVQEKGPTVTITNMDAAEK